MSSRLYGILITKDEADVIVEVVEHALGFCDKIIQLDNFSTDGSWELVGDLAASYPGRIVQLRQFDEKFYDGIRGEIYNAYREELGDGWWLIVSPDEFLVEDPRPLMAEAEAAGADAVMYWMAQFVFTDRDRARWEAGDVEPSRSVRQRIRSYRVDWREYRLFRNDPDLVWDDPNLYLPRPLPTWNRHQRLGMLLHYQFRSPEQIRHRIELRYGLFHHVTSQEWTDNVKPWWKYSTYRGGGIRTTGVWYYARRVRQRIEQRLGRRGPLTGVLKTED